MTEVTKLTHGQKLVGLTFNPSGDDKVPQFKQKIAEAIDLLCEGGSESKIADSFTHQCVNNLIVAQMLGVKAITWKD